MNTLLKEIEKIEGKQLLLFGDFNYRSIDWSMRGTTKCRSRHIALSFLEGSRDGLLDQYINVPTRFRIGQRPSTLYFLFTKSITDVLNCSVESPLGKK